jgi:hypothetical protein
MASSVVPEIVAAYLPSQFFVPAIVATVTLFVSGLVMLRRQTVRRRLRAADATAPTRPRARSFTARPLEPEGVES